MKASWFAYLQIWRLSYKIRAFNFFISLLGANFAINIWKWQLFKLSEILSLGFLLKGFLNRKELYLFKVLMPLACDLWVKVKYKFHGNLHSKTSDIAIRCGVKKSATYVRISTKIGYQVLKYVSFIESNWHFNTICIKKLQAWTIIILNELWDYSSKGHYQTYRHDSLLNTKNLYQNQNFPKEMSDPGIHCLSHT